MTIFLTFVFHTLAIIGWLGLGLFSLLSYQKMREKKPNLRLKPIMLSFLGLIIVQILLNGGIIITTYLNGGSSILRAFRVLYLGFLMLFFYYWQSLTNFSIIPSNKLKLWMIVLIITVIELLLTGVAYLLFYVNDNVGFGIVGNFLSIIISEICLLGFGILLMVKSRHQDTPQMRTSNQLEFTKSFGFWFIGGSLFGPRGIIPTILNFILLIISNERFKAILYVGILIISLVGLGCIWIGMGYLIRSQFHYETSPSEMHLEHADQTA